MKIAIVYATKYGCTKKCAEILKSYLYGEVSIKSIYLNMTLFLLVVLFTWVKFKKKLRIFVNEI